MFVMYRLSGQPRDWTFYVLTAICTGGVFDINHVVVLRYSASPRQAVAAAVNSGFFASFLRRTDSHLYPQNHGLFWLWSRGAV